MRHLLRRTILGATALLLSAGPALASSTTFKTKGADVTASFTVQETKACGSSTALLQTSLGVQQFETAVRANGTLTKQIQTLVQVSRFDFCSGAFNFDSGTFTGGQVQMNGLESAVIAGHFVLDAGTVVDLNLTVTGTDTTTRGTSSRRENTGNVLTISHTTGSSRSGAVSGTATVNGSTFGTAQMLEQDCLLARHTSGELTILKP